MIHTFVADIPVVSRAWDHFSWWWLHFIGADNEQGPIYAFWSAFGSDLGEITLLGLAYAALRRLNCSEPGCFRLGLHPVVGTPYHACHKHHPVIGGGVGKKVRRKGDIQRAHEIAVEQGLAIDHNVQATPTEKQAARKTAGDRVRDRLDAGSGGSVD